MAVGVSVMDFLHHLSENKSVIALVIGRQERTANYIIVSSGAKIQRHFTFADKIQPLHQFMYFILSVAG